LEKQQSKPCIFGTIPNGTTNNLSHFFMDACEHIQEVLMKMEMDIH
jgi:hypothetical protein